MNPAGQRGLRRGGDAPAGADMSAHTPGPWHVNKDQPIVFDTDNKHVVADCYDREHPFYAERMLYAERYANACLIAAAPDLLSALKQLVADYGDVPDPTDADGNAVMDAARAAIVKATGAA